MDDTSTLKIRIKKLSKELYEAQLELSDLEYEKQISQDISNKILRQQGFKVDMLSEKLQSTISYYKTLKLLGE